VERPELWQWDYGETAGRLSRAPNWKVDIGIDANATIGGYTVTVDEPRHPEWESGQRFHRNGNISAGTDGKRRESEHRSARADAHECGINGSTFRVSDM